MNLLSTSLMTFVCLLGVSTRSFATTGDDVKEKTQAAVSSAADYTKEKTLEQKERVQKEMETDLQALNKQIAELKDKASQKTGAAKDSLNEQLGTLEKKQKTAQDKLARLQKSSGKAWDDMKTGTKDALKKLSEAYDKAKENFN